MALPGIIANHLLPLGALAPTGPAPQATAAQAPPSGGATAVSLPFEMQQQEQTNWCWAACGVSVERFYSGSATWSRQCDLASQELGLTCCPAGSNPACNVYGYLDRALTRVGHFHTWAPGPAAPAVIQGELANNRPLGVRIAWTRGGAHFVFLSGYYPTAAGDFVTVEDPFFAESTLPLASFPAAYQGTGSWTHTYWTQP